MTRTPDEIESEIADLDIPILMITDALILTADHLDTDLLAFLDRFEQGKIPSWRSDDRLLADLLEHALESSTQIAHIIRALELEGELDH